MYCGQWLLRYSLTPAQWTDDVNVLPTNGCNPHGHHLTSSNSVCSLNNKAQSLFTHLQLGSKRPWIPEFGQVTNYNELGRGPGIDGRARGPRYSWLFMTFESDSYFITTVEESKKSGSFFLFCQSNAYWVLGIIRMGELSALAHM